MLTSNTSEADNNGVFTLSIVERYYDMTTVQDSVQVVANSNDCGLQNVPVEANKRYEVWVEIEPGQPTLRTFEFTVSVDAYDGIPDNMNNKSLWIGPEVELGLFKHYPTSSLTSSESDF